MLLTLSRRQAAQVAVAAQMLADNTRKRARNDDLRRIVRRLACIQLDTISVVARSQYIVPWSRIGHYDQAWLDELLHPERELFEYWGHAASWIDATLLPCFLSRMAERGERFSADRNEFVAENQDLINDVRRRITAEGPLTSLDFERPNPEQVVEPWAWYGGKPAKQALALLWHIGELAINRRINFRREYDLLERVFPEIRKVDPPDTMQERLTLADRALQAMGIARPSWLNDYFRTNWGTRNDKPPGPDEILQALVASERAIPVEIDGLGEAYVSADQEETLHDVLAGYTATRTTLLTPFDNLIWDRDRTAELFDFDYRIECYTPEHKRIYGYFTLPILRRGRLIGRLDPKVDRRTGEFIIKSLHLEPRVRVSNRLAADVRGTLLSFARWNGAETIICQDVPAELRDAVQGDIGS